MLNGIPYIYYLVFIRQAIKDYVQTLQFNEYCIG